MKHFYGQCAKLYEEERTITLYLRGVSSASAALLMEVGALSRSRYKRLTATSEHLNQNQILEHMIHSSNLMMGCK